MTAQNWERVQIKTDNGETVSGIAPVIVSASRSTDIPAFYASWFMERLKRGYITWTNPFNGVAQYVSFQNTRVIIFWSKNPAPMLRYLDVLRDRGIFFLFHFTLNDYEKEELEPHVPLLADRIETFKELAGKIGRERLLWRYDPLILTDTISPELLLERIQRIGSEIYPYTERLTFSFMTPYVKVRRNLAKAGITHKPFDSKAVHLICAGIGQMNQSWGLDVVSCAEEADLTEYSIAHGSCIDPILLMRLFGHDPALQRFLGITFDIFGNPVRSGPNLKDSGQRSLCRCIKSKDIGRYDTCPHLCKYCYANYSPERVLNTCSQISSERDAL